ncbi:hypothetical protein BS17DRAFT_788336 [Gyrodon lividus]|nr:hypothetical protein BS17DRAFT_788336 [Gyrodon lividus]
MPPRSASRLLMNSSKCCYWYLILCGIGFQVHKLEAPVETPVPASCSPFNESKRVISFIFTSTTPCSSFTTLALVSDSSLQFLLFGLILVLVTTSNKSTWMSPPRPVIVPGALTLSSPSHQV